MTTVSSDNAYHQLSCLAADGDSGSRKKRGAQSEPMTEDLIQTISSGKRTKTGLLRPGDMDWILQSQRAHREHLISLGIHGHALQQELKANRARLRKALGVNPAHTDKR